MQYRNEGHITTGSAICAKLTVLIITNFPNLAYAVIVNQQRSTSNSLMCILFRHSESHQIPKDNLQRTSANFARDSHLLNSYCSSFIKYFVITVVFGYEKIILGGRKSWPIGVPLQTKTRTFDSGRQSMQSLPESHGCSSAGIWDSQFIRRIR